MFKLTTVLGIRTIQTGDASSLDAVVFHTNVLESPEKKDKNWPVDVLSDSHCKYAAFTPRAQPFARAIRFAEA